MTTMAPRLANLRAVNLPKPPPPPVTSVISPAMLFILYFNGMNKLTIFFMINITVQKRKTITSLAITKNDIFLPLFLDRSKFFFYFYVPTFYRYTLRLFVRNWGRSGWHSSTYVSIKAYGRMRFVWKNHNYDHNVTLDKKDIN